MPRVGQPLCLLAEMISKFVLAFKYQTGLYESPDYLFVDDDPQVLQAVRRDLRFGAMNGVASAVDEGAMSISFVHQCLSSNEILCLNMNDLTVR